MTCSPPCRNVDVAAYNSLLMHQCVPAYNWEFLKSMSAFLHSPASCRLPVLKSRSHILCRKSKILLTFPDLNCKKRRDPLFGSASREWNFKVPCMLRLLTSPLWCHGDSSRFHTHSKIQRPLFLTWQIILEEAENKRPHPLPPARSNYATGSFRYLLMLSTFN